ncbi:general transcription factor 3C polypeptide 6 isoform X1 [Manis pentadactyla]|uniref:general transcription factor 3C polypeptide 6 isoform X1 n=1 Tax=Manis pentadactyla TaxID=143292 RepID=UPI00255CBCA0|nr:general transcription factor 3C polypeptide 6 isoform X1 [Manis pentadactyla]
MSAGAERGRFRGKGLKGGTGSVRRAATDRARGPRPSAHRARPAAAGTSTPWKRRRVREAPNTGVTGSKARTARFRPRRGRPRRLLLLEQLVVVELSGIIDSDFLSKCDGRCKILGIDTARPILQVDSYVFAGEYEDTLGTCVIFEENVEHVDTEGSNKTALKYRCHTMKKLSMTRTLLTEKKEGEENIGGVEWLQIKDNDFSYRPNMICSFLHENEDEEVVASAPDKPLELEEQETQMKENSDLSDEQEKPPALDREGCGAPDATSGTEGSVFMESQDSAFEITPR